MIKRPLPRGDFEVVTGERYVTSDDPFKYETHIYLEKGEEMHGGIGRTPSEALMNAVTHWLSSERRRLSE